MQYSRMQLMLMKVTDQMIIDMVQRRCELV